MSVNIGIPVHPQLRTLFNNPGFWRGALSVRNADLDAASEAGAGVGSWLQDAAGRVRTLLEAAREGSVDVTTLPEFERWLTSGGAARFKENRL